MESKAIVNTHAVYKCDGCGRNFTADRIIIVASDPDHEKHFCAHVGGCFDTYKC